MDDQNTKNQAALAANENSENLNRIDFLFSQIPDHVNEWLFSDTAAQNVRALAKKFNLSPDQTAQLARITGLAALKDFPLTNLVPELKESLNLDDSTAKQLAVATALTQFLVIRDHLVEVGGFIRQLGGSLPATLPPLAKASTSSTVAPIPTPMAISIIQKTLRQIAKDNKDSLNQLLTNAPIKIADFEQPVRPTIKNWLVDYVKTKGAGHHESLERGDYLFSSPNAKPLSEEGRNLVSAILKAYDDDLPLPVNSQDQTILLEKIEEPLVKEPTAIPAAPQKTINNTLGGYREPILKEDLAGPLKDQAPPKPAPRLSGNIIDLKDMQ